MASLYKKVINGRPYWYLREMAWIDGRPKMVSERYLGSASDVAAALQDREAATRPERTRHLAFGGVAAAWGAMVRLGVVEIIDEVVGQRRSDAGASVGTYLALAACNRLVDPRSKRGFEAWWQTTAADRFTRIRASVLDHRKFWDAMHAVTDAQLEKIQHRLALHMIETFDLDVCSLALDMTNFATYIDTTNDKAPIAQRGKAKQKRSDLRLVGLGLVVTRDGGVPLVSHAYPGNRPDVTQFATMIDQLMTRYTAVATTATPGADEPGPQMTVVFDAGQNSVANFAHLAATGLGFVGSVPPSDCPDLLTLPAAARRVVDTDRFAGLTALERRREVYGTQRRVVLTHSPTLHAAQSRGFDQTLATASAKLSALADTLARGQTRRPRDKVEAEITTIVKDPWVRRVLRWELTGDTPPEHRLRWHLDDTARADLDTEVFSKRVLITDREHSSSSSADEGEGRPREASPSAADRTAPPRSGRLPDRRPVGGRLDAADAPEAPGASPTSHQARALIVFRYQNGPLGSPIGPRGPGP